MTRRSKAFDWEKVRAQLALSGHRLEQTLADSDEERERVYRKRADLLAQPRSRQDDSSGEKIIVFRLGAARFAIPLIAIAEIIVDSRTVPAPGAPPEVAGLMQVRGEVRPIWNLGRLLGLPDSVPHKGKTVLLLRRGSREIGVQVDSAEDILEVAPAMRRPAPPGFAHVVWTTEDSITVLDVHSLLERPTEGL
jgi:purine-binding chemotaxis protein CheW